MDPAPPTIGSLIVEGERALAAAGIAPARLEAEVLLARSLSVSRASLILDPRARVEDAPASAYRAAVAKRAGRYPLQYITGIQEFYSLDFEVDARVLIPRSETELIVDEVLRMARAEAEAPAAVRPSAPGAPSVPPAPGASEVTGRGEGPLIVDVGTGSGCLAVTLAVRLPGCRVFASDVSEGALAVAARNAARHGVSARIRFARGDGLAPARDAGLAGRADVLVSNPPYIDEADLAGLQPELAFEPRGALTPGPDGLAFTARLVADAAEILAPGGRLLVELGAGSAPAARALLDPALWDAIAVLPDAQGMDRVLSARRGS